MRDTLSAAALVLALTVLLAVPVITTFRKAVSLSGRVHVDLVGAHPRLHACFEKLVDALSFNADASEPLLPANAPSMLQQVPSAGPGWHPTSQKPSMTSTDGVHEFLSDGNTQNVDTPDHCRGSDPETRIESKLAAWKSSSCIIRRLPSKDQAEQPRLIKSSS